MALEKFHDPDQLAIFFIPKYMLPPVRIRRFQWPEDLPRRLTIRRSTVDKFIVVRAKQTEGSELEVVRIS